MARLGPESDEPFVRIDDVDPGAPLAALPPLDTDLDQVRFVALDCETTGQSPHRLVELGAVAFTLTGHLASFETLVHSNDRINPFAQRIHRISATSLAGAPRIDQVLERFLHFAAGAVLVEHSADAFDTRLIAKSLGERFQVINLDTSRMAGRLWDLRDTIGLERLCRELGVTHRGPHHALGDAEATAACFLKLLELGRETHGWGSLRRLVEDAQPPPPRYVLLAEAAAARVRDGHDRAPAPSADGSVAGAAGRRRRRGGRRRRGTAEPGGGAHAHDNPDPNSTGQPPAMPPPSDG
ncbi:MAG: PolC-type DNA polymerase III [Candidatus Dormibacteria bacterium]